MLESSPLRHGTHRDGEHVRWNVWAPRAATVELLLYDGDRTTALPMEQRGEWWTRGECGIEPGRRYKFQLDGRNAFPDPASRSQPAGVHGASEVFFADAFEWSDGAWRGVALSDLVIYELHVGTFTPQGTFDAIVPRLDALVELGVNCLEIMPVAQFPGTRGWGYDGVYPFAVQQSYGGPRGLQRLVDACHARGLAVLLDVVFNHLGPEGNYSGRFGPYFTEKHHTPWGAAWNYDDAGSPAVRAYVLENVAYWLREFHFDGLRLDAVHAICDAGPTHILREIQVVAETEAARSGRAIHIVAESNTNDVKLLDAPEAGGYGLDAMWNDDFHHAVHALLTGERDGYYADYGAPEHLVKVYNRTFAYDGNYCPRRKQTFGTPVNDHGGKHFVASIQNHDQVGNRMLGDRFGTLLSPAQQRLAAALMLLSPFTPLLFMGEEYGESRPFPFFCDFGDQRLVDAVRAGRRAEFAHFGWTGELPDPQARATFDSAVLGWNWDGEPWRVGLRRWYGDLIEARRVWPLLKGESHRHAAWHPAKAVAAAQPAAGVLSLQRGSPGDDRRLTILFNLSAASVSFPTDSELCEAAHGMLLSSAWPPYTADTAEASRAGSSAVAGQLFPWEVVVFRTLGTT